MDRTLDRIIQGVFHHPNLRDFGQDGAVDGRRGMFSVVQQWWGSKDEQERDMLRDQLSRDGVEQGRNHKEGVHDTGHGCGKPMKMPTMGTANSSGALGGLAGGLAGGAVLGEISSALSGESQYDSGFSGGSHSGGGDSAGIGKFAEEAVGGGALGGIVGGLAGAIGGDLLGGAFGGSSSEKKTYQSQRYEEDGSYTQSVTETGYRPQQGSGQAAYGQAEYSRTNFSGGGQRQEYQRYEQDDEQARTGYGERITQDSRPTYGGGFERTTETRYEQPGGSWESEIVRERRDSSGRTRRETEECEGHGGFDRDTETNTYAEERTERYGDQRSGYGQGRRNEGYGGNERFQERSEYESNSNDRPSYGGQEYGGRQSQEYGGRQGGSERTEEYSSREDFSERQDYGRSGGRQEYEETETFQEERRDGGGGRGYGQEEEYTERREDDEEYGDRRY